MQPHATVSYSTRRCTSTLLLDDLQRSRIRHDNTLGVDTRTATRRQDQTIGASQRAHGQSISVTKPRQVTYACDDIVLTLNKTTTNTRRREQTVFGEVSLSLSLFPLSLSLSLSFSHSPGPRICTDKRWDTACFWSYPSDVGNDIAGFVTCRKGYSPRIGSDPEVCECGESLLGGTEVEALSTARHTPRPCPDAFRTCIIF